MSLKPLPLVLNEANAFVERHHRHSLPVVGCRFAIGASDGENLVGVAIVGRPIARLLQDGFTAEVLRCCVLPEAPRNAPSFLYGRCWRIWQQMGGDRLVTYTLERESGASLRGAGWKILGTKEPVQEGGGWQNRPGRRWQQHQAELRLRWEAS